MLLEKNFNLSKTEFIAYLKCPFSFYLMKEISKPTEHNDRVSYSDYELFLQDGIANHLWLQNFYKLYAKDIQNNITPTLTEHDKNEEWKKIFLEKEINRFKEHPDFWEPIAVEYFINLKCVRGKIDRIDQLNNQGQCCVVEYKAYPELHDEEELLFYACLLTSVLPNSDLPCIKKVSEIGVYYYKTGNLYKAKIKSKTIKVFGELISNIRTEMLNPLSIKKKKDCDSINTKCLYREICKRIHIKKQKVIGLSKI